MTLHRYFATCARGLEPMLADELRELGAADVAPGRGGVAFAGDRAVLYRANLWLRTAVRVLQPILEATVTSPDELYEAVFVNGTLLLSRMCAGFDYYVIDSVVDGAAYVTRFVSWVNGLFDNYVIDGIVNRVADITMGIGNRFRQLQTGSINGYLYVIVVGVVVVMVARLL